MLCLKSCCTDSCISCQDIIYIIKSLIIGCDTLILHSKSYLVIHLYICGIKIDLRTFKSAFWASVIAKLAVMIKTVNQTLTTAFAETSLSDLIGLAPEHRLADSVSYIRISAVHSQICRQRIIAVHNDFHIRNFPHHFLQDIHGNINLTITVQLIPEQIGHNHIVRLDPGKYVSCGCFVYLDTGIVCIQLSAWFCSQHKSSHNTVKHVGTCMIADYFLPLCLKSCAEHVVGSCLTVSSTYYKYLFSYLRGKFLQNIRTYLQCNLTGPGYSLASHKFTDISCDLCCYHSNCSFYFHNRLFPLFLFRSTTDPLL